MGWRVTASHQCAARPAYETIRPMYRFAKTALLCTLPAACGDTAAAPDTGATASIADASVTIADAASSPLDATPAIDAIAPDAALPGFNAAFCSQVSGTLNIHWEAVGGVSAPCTGIEVTDGVVADATAKGSIMMSGVSVSNDQCIATAAYVLVLSGDTLGLMGFDTDSNIGLTLTRQSDEACFVGHWTDGAEDFVAHISAAAFGITLN